MRKVVVIGCSGAGKTEFSRRLAEKTALPLVHLDKLYWRAGWRHVSAEEFDALHAAELEKPAWILDGNYNRTLPVRLNACDTAIFLRYPRRVCLLGAVKRYLKGRGKCRADVGEGCPEKPDAEFLKYIWNYDKRFGEKYCRMLEESGAAHYVFKSRREAEAFLQSLPDFPRGTSAEKRKE